MTYFTENVNINSKSYEDFSSKAFSHIKKNKYRKFYSRDFDIDMFQVLLECNQNRIRLNKFVFLVLMSLFQRYVIELQKM